MTQTDCLASTLGSGTIRASHKIRKTLYIYAYIWMFIYTPCGHQSKPKG